ncbi:MAG: P-loop NTPase [Bacteroidales bacterium]
MEIAVISGKGGTGKSSICGALATLGKQVMMADCDVDAANLHLILEPEPEEEEAYPGGYKAEIDPLLCTQCGICAKFCRFEAIALADGKFYISQINCEGCFLCSHVCPVNAIQMNRSYRSMMYSGTFRNGRIVYGRLAPGDENSGKMVSKIREKAKKLAAENHLEIILLDGPPGIGCPVISTITGVDQVIIITEPTLSGFHDLKRTVEMVRPTGIPAAVIINKYDLNKEISIQIDHWCEFLSIPVSGRLPYDEHVTGAMIHGKTITEWAPDTEISREINQIWKKLST